MSVGQEIEEAIAEVQQSRSQFQLVHFVLGQHDTPEMQYYQLVLELQDMGTRIRMAKIELEKMRIDVQQMRIKQDRLLETGDELDALEAKKLELEIEEREVGEQGTLIVMRGAEREMAILVDFFEQSKKYTRAEIEHAQPEYWHKRVTRQTNLQIMSGNVGWSQLDDMRAIGLLDELVEARQDAAEEVVKELQL